MRAFPLPLPGINAQRSFRATTRIALRLTVPKKIPVRNPGGGAQCEKKWGFQYSELAQEEDDIEKPFWWSDTTAAVLDEKDGLEAWLHDMGFTVLVHDLDNAESDSD